jgi:nucleoside-diphosphate-sugar epimerase
MARIVITGGSGFIGSALAAHLCNRCKVRIVDNRNGQPKSGDRIEFMKCDIRDYRKVKRVLGDADIVIHTAIVQIPRINEERRLGYEVNIMGTQNVCEAVRQSRSTKGLIVVGSWHTIGERKVMGIIDERFGFRPDWVEDRARLYVLSKIAQESIVRHYDEDSQDKTYGVIRIGTTLGENMPKGTAAGIFIDRGLRGQSLTPYEHSMHRPMLYVDIEDVCRAFESYAFMILDGKLSRTGGSSERVVNVYYPEPVTVLELAYMVRESITRCSQGRVTPEVVVTRTGERSLNTPEDKKMMQVDASKIGAFLGLDKLVSPQEAIDRIVSKRYSNMSRTPLGTTTT